MAGNVYINELSNHVDTEVTLSGWLYRGRSSGKVLFLVLRDGTGLCQCIVEKGKLPDETFDALKHLGQESSLTITGIVRAEPRSPGGHELAATGAKIINESKDYPITPKAHGVDFLLKHR
ncbi:MAG: asparagine--tRNA ligase, partial [Planctomycetes bacterium]|nr:asparagine--tRNA ligase [Planctomycetota bacterium]